MRMAGSNKCHHCRKGELNSSGWVGCDLCGEWFHKKCVYLHGVQDADLSKVDWMCKTCRKKVMDCYNERKYPQGGRETEKGK